MSDDKEQLLTEQLKTELHENILQLNQTHPLPFEGKKEKISNKAAISILIKPGQESPAELLFIRRAAHPKDPWSGHMAFPGGRHEKEDHSFRHTAERETFEELGLKNLEDFSFLGALSPVTTQARHLHQPLEVFPYVYWTNLESFKKGYFQPDKKEVDNYHWISIEHFLDLTQVSMQSVSIKTKTLHWPAIRFEKNKIWGLSYIILSELMTLILKTKSARKLGYLPFEYWPTASPFNPINPSNS